MNLSKEKNSLRLIRLKIYINFLRSLISSTTMLNLLIEFISHLSLIKLVTIFLVNLSSRKYLICRSISLSVSQLNEFRCNENPIQQGSSN
ncbi:hypothetical protein BpHYR1_018562 [Brachionus plicatilis]|uniref:Uncharacterized protein n=1 Tax=Brachionus plicatilis TaxID=10195 RepID=A0A3M7PYD0_BRAPC|nr:hypothetical protein BpHYR1_018562 [Brachionus plicatilis]